MQTILRTPGAWARVGPRADVFMSVGESSARAIGLVSRGMVERGRGAGALISCIGT